jgi:hypothetical protein
MTTLANPPGSLSPGSRYGGFQPSRRLRRRSVPPCPLATTSGQRVVARTGTGFEPRETSGARPTGGRPRNERAGSVATREPRDATGGSVSDSRAATPRDKRVSPAGSNPESRRSD